MIRRDYLLHVETCALIVVAASLLLPWWAAGLLALGAGIGKEIHDKAGAGVASWKDVICDAVGTAVGLILILL